ncbi:hypothetical protein L1F30_11490 [Simiduia sp. 21SJ11W-1]|uniref:hypothetical protein n=1 Tax=Simiduia sp. 21SJ11W-1 TaxID=2909669 RepID=UPI00209ECB12|nr:hypothetical protein [Simiduia sp. 21SJ11W-1]UTA46782.1 hypothetical protein L1F30_11490 [Simiduia sp. 21SJ11W-1]
MLSLPLKAALTAGLISALLCSYGWCDNIATKTEQHLLAEILTQAQQLLGTAMPRINANEPPAELWAATAQSQPTAAKCLLLGCSLRHRRTHILLGPGPLQAADERLPLSERSGKNEANYEHNQARTLLKWQLNF